MSRVLAAVLALLMVAAVPTESGSAGPTFLRGYLPVDDGTLLHYRVALPPGPGPFPVAVTYAGYTTQFGGFEGGPPGFDAGFVDAGYARVNVTVRGAGCSGGTWDMFSPQEADDGVDVLRWVEAQAWSDDEAIALMGESYGAIMALMVAKEDGAEPYLDVVVAPHPMVDLYRDVLYPGGIPNATVPAAFTANQNQLSAGDALASMDTTCAAHVAARGPSVANTPPLAAASHPFDDAWMRERSPGTGIEGIDAPVFTTFAWQDDTLGSRGIDLLSQLDVPYQAIVGNGHHQLWYDAVGDAIAFLDHHLRGIGELPDSPITVWWEKADGPPPFRGPVTWASGLGAWPPPQAKTLRFELSEGGRLVDGSGTGESDRYVAGTPGQSQATGPGLAAWSNRPPDGAALAYTTEPFDRDLTVLGHASLDLWLSSSLPDTDVQVTVTEVREDGREVYVQQGWLRASHRELDSARSTETRPVHTHHEADVEPLLPGEASELRIEILPFGHVFRKGSRLRVWIESPKTAPDLWAFPPTAPAVNEVHHDADRPSALVLSVIPGGGARADADPCGELRLLRQPCR